MPKLAKEMSPIEVRNLKHSGKRNDVPEKYAVGGVSGLLLQVTPGGAKSWILRLTIGCERKLMGLGSFPEVSLKDAREKAAIVKQQVRDGINPIVERKAKRAALAAASLRGRTFTEATAEFLNSKLGDKSKKHRAQWRSTLETYAIPELGAFAVDDIATSDVLRVLKPLWETKTETASRLRSRIEAVLNYAIVLGYRRNRDNPAQWAGNLKELLPSPKKIKKVRHHPAIPIKDMPRWYAALRRSDSISAMALEFLTLTACRSGEVRGATWGEIDIKDKVWIIPAGRMKMKREHRIPLCNRAIEILRQVPRFPDSEHVFPSPLGAALSDMALSEFMRDMHAREEKAGRKPWVDSKSGEPAVVHGLRSVFRDWCAEHTNYPREVAEMALAHAIGDKVEAAYRRGDLFEKRRQLMNEWARFCSTPQKPDKSSKVVNIRGR